MVDIPFSQTKNEKIDLSSFHPTTTVATETSFNDGDNDNDAGGNVYKTTESVSQAVVEEYMNQYAN